MRVKFLLKRPISESVDGGVLFGGGKNVHRSDLVVFGLFFAPDQSDSKVRGTVVVGGPRRFRGDMLKAMQVFKSRDIYQLPSWGNKEKWAANKRSRKQFNRGVAQLREDGWKILRVRGFRRLMG